MLKQEKEDLRVMRTKKALSSAFLELLSQKEFEHITINELCAVAGIRRATFYKHYSDKLSFLTEFTRSLRDRFDKIVWKLDSPAPSKDYYIAYAKRIVSYISENATAIQHLVSSEMFPAVFAVIVEQNYNDTCAHLQKSVAAGLSLHASIEVTASMCAGGISVIIYNWLKSGQKKTVDELSNEIGVVVSRLIGV